jgi:hypothetical protein
MLRGRFAPERAHREVRKEAAMSVRSLRSRPLRVALVAALVVAAALVQPAGAAAQPAASSKPAIFDDGDWYLRASLSTGVATSTFRYGRPGDLPVMGDWDGDGTDTVGVVRLTGSGGTFQWTWFLRNANSGGTATVPAFVFGDVRFVAVDQLGTIPVVGDWDGNGTYTPAVLRNRPATDESGGFEHWLFRNSNSTGGANFEITYGSDAFELSPPIEVIPRLSWR